MQFGLMTGAIVGSTAAAYMYADVSANMADEGLHPPSHPWSHSGPLETFDHASYVDRFNSTITYHQLIIMKL